MSKKDYVISTGMVSLFENRYGLRLNQEMKDNIRELEHKFIEDLKPHLKDKFNYIVLYEKDIYEGVKILLDCEKRPLISLDDVYLLEKMDEMYNITRLTNPDNFEDKEFGPRPVASVLNEQLTRMAKKYAGQDVILFDIGIFSGKTLQSEIKRIKNKNIYVKKVYMAIGCKENMDKLKEEEGVDVVAANCYRFGEWIEIRDLFGFDGRKVKMKGITEFGAYDYNSIVIIPYKENLCGWASIPAESEKEVKRLCESYNKKVIRILSDKYEVIYKPIRRNTNGTRTYLLSFKEKGG